MFVLSPFVDVIHVVNPEFRGLHALPARREPLALQGVAPVGCVGVVVDVIFPSSDSPVH